MRMDREHAERRRRNLITGGIVAGVVVLVAVAAVAISTASDDSSDGGTPDGVTEAGGVMYDQEVATGKSSSGTDPVEVIAYEDFYCPACGAFEQASSEFLRSEVEKGTITVEYRPVAILDRMSPDEYSTRAASAAACVVDDAGVDAFYEFHQTLYENQPAEGSPGHDAAQLTSYAEDAGAGGVGACIEDEEFKGWVSDQTQEFGESAPEVQTPTVLVDGERVSTPSPEGLQQAIDEAS